MRYLTPLLLAAAASVLSTGAAYADLGDQLFKLLPDDGAEFDFFGKSVAISGTTAIVGAHSDDDNGSSSGSAYLFDTTTGQQIAKLLADDGASEDLFGFSVAISGTTAIVGALWDDDNGIDSGSAYLFDTTTGLQIDKLLPNDGAPSDIFGASVAISGPPGREIAIVGAYQDDDNGINSGSAYLFHATTGRQIGKLLPNDGAAIDWFGISVAIDGPPGEEIAIVGALGDDDNGEASGSAYLFDVTTGAQFAKLLPDDGAAFDGFGRSVAISGVIAIVGAEDDDDNGIDSGSVYLFEISDLKNPVQIAKFLPNDGAAVDRFGISVAISGTPGSQVAIVAAWGDDDNGDHSGSAYLIDISNPEEPSQIAKLLPNDGAAGDFFGSSVAIDGMTAIVGAFFDGDNGYRSGSAYLFDSSSCPWDLDGSGSVGASDLLSLLASWGPCKGCPADFDFDDDVGASDLLALLVNWGPCL
ncbi:MAG: FG-GAP repeat protein [Phycisphaerales bacterium]